MKKTTLLLLLGLSVCFSSHSQRRNMLGNADFETISEGNLTDWSLGGNGIFPTDVAFGDLVVSGLSSLAVYGTGDTLHSMVSANSPRFFTTNFGDQYKYKFKANLVGVATATMKVEFQINWGISSYLFNDEIVLAEGTHEYSLTSKVQGPATAPVDISDRSLFSMQFGKIPLEAKLFIDDVELTNITDNWSGNIKTNYNFEHPIKLFDFWTFGSYSADIDSISDLGNKSAKMTVNGASGYDCLTGRCFIFNETANKNYKLEITAKSSVELDSSYIQVGNGGGFPGFGTSKFVLTTEKKTFTVDWPATAIPGSTTYYLDLRLAASAPVGTNVWVYEYKVNEVIPLNSISIVMPDNVASGATVPVGVRANPTDANNAVTLAVTSGTGTVSEVNGEWFYTANSGTSTITATSKVNATLAASKVVESTTGVNNPAADNIIVYPTQVKTEFYIKGVEANATIDIYNNIGQLVKSTKNVTAVSVSGWAKGLYVIKVKSGSNTVGRRIFVL